MIYTADIAGNMAARRLAIELAAQEYCRNDSESWAVDFYAGARWADANPPRPTVEELAQLERIKIKTGVLQQSNLGSWRSMAWLVEMLEKAWGLK